MPRMLRAWPSVSAASCAGTSMVTDVAVAQHLAAADPDVGDRSLERALNTRLLSGVRVPAAWTSGFRSMTEKSALQPTASFADVVAAQGLGAADRRGGEDLAEAGRADVGAGDLGDHEGPSASRRPCCAGRCPCRSPC